MERKTSVSRIYLTNNYFPIPCRQRLITKPLSVKPANVLKIIGTPHICNNKIVVLVRNVPASSSVLETMGEYRTRIRVPRPLATASIDYFKQNEKITR